MFYASAFVRGGEKNHDDPFHVQVCSLFFKFQLRAAPFLPSTWILIAILLRFDVLGRAKFIGADFFLCPTDVGFESQVEYVRLDDTFKNVTQI